MREAALYGAEVVKVTGTYDQAKKVASDFAARRNIHFDKGAKSIAGKESMKTVAFEIAEELAKLSGQPDGARWEGARAHTARLQKLDETPQPARVSGTGLGRSTGEAREKDLASLRPRGGLSGT